MDILTLVYVTMFIYGCVLLFFILAALRVIWYLADIRMELRELNDRGLTEKK
jgi:hypothetical protein